MAMFHKTLARSAAELAVLRPLWDELVRRAPKTMFQRFDWNLLACELFGERLAPLVAAVDTDTGAAIIPACIKTRAGRIELVGELLFDYRDVLHIGDRAALQAAWQMVAEFELPLSVTAVQPENARDTWADFSIHEFARAPWVDADRLSEHDFRRAHSRVGSRLRKIIRKGVTLHEYSGGKSAAIRRLYDLKSDRFAADTNNIFQDSTRREFMVQIAAQQADRCRLYTLEDAAECIVAGLMTFLDGSIRRFYTIYFDPQWAPYSPGVALVFEVTARSLAEGISCDYMTGEYPYKLRFANASRMLYQVEATAEGLKSFARADFGRRVA